MSKQRIEEHPVFENCRIMFRNFSGEQSQYNRAGDRNFCVVIDDIEAAKRMAEDGWNIKYRPPRDEGGEETAYLQVSVSYMNQPPKIVLVTSHGRTMLKEDTVGMLDYADIENVDLIVNPYNWEVNGKSGVKAYLKTMYVTIREDPIEAKYAGSNALAPDDEIPF